jgi:hypothetical protein
VGRVGTLHLLLLSSLLSLLTRDNVILQSKHIQLMTAAVGPSM